MILSSHQIESFHKDGFLLLDNFFSDIELKRFDNALKKIINNQLNKAKKKHHELEIDFVGKEFDEAMIKLEEVDHQYIADIYDTIYSTAAFLSLSTKKEITECINQLLERELDDPLYLDQSRCRIDTPFDPYRKKCGWHQEVFYYIPKSDFVQTWAPLIHHAKKEIGTIEVCVGSHKEIARQSNEKPDNEKYPYIVEQSEVKKYNVQIMELKLGQLLIFNSKLVHRSGDNVSKKVRYSLVGINHNIDNEFFSPPRFIEVEQKEKFEKYYDSSIKNE